MKGGQHARAMMTGSDAGMWTLSPKIDAIRDIKQGKGGTSTAMAMQISSLPLRRRPLLSKSLQIQVS